MRYILNNSQELVEIVLWADRAYNLSLAREATSIRKYKYLYNKLNYSFIILSNIIYTIISILSLV